MVSQSQIEGPSRTLLGHDTHRQRMELNDVATWSVAEILYVMLLPTALWIICVLYAVSRWVRKQNANKKEVPLDYGSGLPIARDHLTDL